MENGTAIYNKQEILKGISNHNIDYDWFSAVGKVRLKSPDQNVSVKIYLRIKRDSAIWMVVKKLGIEVARVLITPEEVSIVYRLEKVYEQEKLSTVLDEYNSSIGFTQLQDYLIGNLPTLDPTNFEYRNSENQIVCQTQIEGMLSFLRLNQLNLNIEDVELYNQKNESVKIRYTDYQTINAMAVPFGRKFDLSSMELGELSAHFNLSEIEIDVPKSLKFSIPPHYDKLQFYKPF